jgi:signal transduction histidine kinase
MRLLQVNLRGLLLYSIILVLISIPVSLFSIQAILNEEVDESISRQADQFISHIQGFEYLDDLETDLTVIDKLSYNVHIKPAAQNIAAKNYLTISLYDSAEQKEKPFRQLITGVMIKGKPYELTVRMSTVDNNDLVMAIGLVQVVLSILLASGLLLLNRSLSKRLWKPFYKTLDQLKAYELDKNETIPVEKSNIIEFNDLNKTVRHLTERNRKVFLNQKEFIENASHELQTPIAIFQSKLDTLMQSSSLRQTDAETLMELESTAQRMARLNKNLLLLSKIENDQFLEKEEIDLAELIKSQVAALQSMTRPENIKIITSLSPLTLKANRTLIEVLLTNLLHNAIRYTSNDENIKIHLNDGKFSISNKAAVSEMNFEKLTERFSKISTEPDSTGLGLSIVKKICDSCGYTLHYAYNDSRHTFSVDFRQV